MKKFDRMEAFIASLDTGTQHDVHPCYAGYFACFNAGEYYEAHDVLEHLWLQCEDANALYYKGLIQAAGAFVHLRKQHLRPHHPKDGRRLAPASRLFDLSASNLEPFSPRHIHLDVAALVALCRDLAGRIRASDFTVNPWHPDHPPQLRLEPAP